jgi:hypothetical protein
MGIIAIGVVALVLLAILLLQFDAVTTRLLPLASRFLPWNNATLQADKLALSGVSRLRSINLRITVPGEGRLLTIDSLDLSIRPLALLARRADISAIRVRGVRAVARQQPDSSWTLIAPFTAKDTVPPAEPMRIRIGAVDVSDVTVIGRYTGTPDSLLVDDLLLRMHDVMVDSTLAFELDTVHARVMAPGRARPAVLSGRASLSEGLMTVAGFRLQSDSSNVTANGNLVLPGEAGGEIREVDFRLAAEPLDFRDVAPLAPPNVNLPASMRLTARVTGQSSLLAVNVDGRTSDGAVIHVDGRLTPMITGPVRYELDGSIRNLDPAMLGLTNTRGRTGAEFEINLAGDSLRAVNGTASLRLAALKLDGMELSPSTVTARVENSVARYRIKGSLLPWVSASGGGTLDLTRATPSYSIDLRLSQLQAFPRELGPGMARPLQAVPDSGVNVRGVVALVRATGSGFAANEREGSATLQIEEGQVGNARVAHGSWQRPLAAGPRHRRSRGATLWHVTGDGQPSRASGVAEPRGRCPFRVSGSRPQGCIAWYAPVRRKRNHADSPRSGSGRQDDGPRHVRPSSSPPQALPPSAPVTWNSISREACSR